MGAKLPGFSYHPDVADRFPTIRAGVFYATGLSNGPAPPALAEEYQAQQQTTLNLLEGKSLAEVPSLGAWRRVFTAFGVKPTQYRNAAEALLRRLVKAGDIPSLNLLVDLGNLVSIRYALPVAVFDQAEITGATAVRFAAGDERFVGLGAGESSPEPGEVVFVDETDQVSARRWCWRQSAGSATGPSTTQALITVEAHHDSAQSDLEHAVADLSHLLTKYQPTAQWEAALLSPAEPSFVPAGFSTA